MKKYRTRAPAKINLFLEVGGKRDDGFHEITTVMVPVGIHDEMEIRQARRFSLEVEGLKLTRLKGRNIVEKAWRAVRRRRRIPPVRIRLVKRIPAESGLGGGSSDGAAVLKGLDRLFDLDLDLQEIAAELGSDMPFFLQDGPALCTGRGEEVAPLARPIRGWAVVVWPGYGLSTSSVYSNHKILTKPPRRVINFLNVVRKPGIWRVGEKLFNRLETAAFALEPRLKVLHRRLKRFPFAGVRMTGSGTALYGLCASRVEAERLARQLVDSVPFVTVGALLEPGVKAWKSPRSASS